VAVDQASLVKCNINFMEELSKSKRPDAGGSHAGDGDVGLGDNCDCYGGDGDGGGDDD
jgi:hypothetical protein